MPSNKAELLLPFGVSADGAPVWHDLAGLPHVLAAGTTNSGKSVFPECGALSLALRLGPEALELLMIDVKSVDFSAFAGLPHLRDGRIISDPEQAVEALHVLTTDELPKRTAILKEAKCANFRDLIATAPDCGLKNIVVIIDEFADLVAVLPRDARDDLGREMLRLAQRARAAGIYLVIATQRPTTEFISGTTKANLPCRLSFYLPQRQDSLVILDQPGAEKLLGTGDMLVLHEGRLQRLQGYYMEAAQQAALLAERYPAMAAMNTNTHVVVPRDLMRGLHGKQE